MKTVVINAGPKRRDMNAQLARSAAKGAESVGSQVEYVDLYKLDLCGCRSCLICKQEGKSGKCYWRDELSPLIERILDADCLLIAAPIFFTEPTSHYRALIERLIFCILSYDATPPYYESKLNVGLFFTMNMPKELYDTYRGSIEFSANSLSMLNGEVKVYPVFNTLQVRDYSKYSMAAFNEEDKTAYREENFPIDLENAFKIGAELSK